MFVNYSVTKFVVINFRCINDVVGAIPGEDGTYHIPGSLTVAPVSATKKILSNCSQIGKISARLQHVTLVAPIHKSQVSAVTVMTM